MSRQIRNEADYQAMRLLLQRVHALEGPPDYCTIGDLDWWRATGEDTDAIQQARIWIDVGGVVVGFAWPNGNQLDHISHPAHRELEPAMISWAEAQIRRSGEHASMSVFAFEGHGWRLAQLSALGFERGDDALRMWHRSLDKLSVTQPVGDYVIRFVRGECDVQERVAAHRDAFTPSRMTVEKHRAVMASPTYRAELDLIAVAPDGTIAAFCVVWLDVDNAHGVFEPVGCRLAHRQRGLSKEIILEGMRRIRDLGARSASVASSPSNVAANRLYASAGFVDVDVNAEWIKRLS